MVICHYPGRGNTNFVKRVVGVPGDTLMFVDNVLIRNGEVVDEPYLTPSRNQNGFSMLPITLGENEYFVCGDNRDNSHDCRNLTNGVPEAITRDMIVGHVRYVVYPFSDARSIN